MPYIGWNGEEIEDSEWDNMRRDGAEQLAREGLEIAKHLTHLLTPQLRVQIPELYKTESNDDPIVWTRWSISSNVWEWFVIELDQHDGIAYALCCGFERELGYVSVQEIMSVEPLWRPIRDEGFTPRPLSAVRRVRKH